MQEIDMDCPTTKFCVSVMAGKLCQVGLQNHISAWNNHRIPGVLHNDNVKSCINVANVTLQLIILYLLMKPHYFFKILMQ